MKTASWYDKSAWQIGVWLTEPDYAMWIDEDSMYPCVLRRNIFGAWAGYVGLSSDHPLYQAYHTERTFDFIDVYGGVTFSGFSKEDDLEVSPPTRRWWVGFECMLQNDICPAFSADADAQRKKRKSIDPVPHHPIYRTMQFTKSHTESLAAQLATIDDRLTYTEEIY